MTVLDVEAAVLEVFVAVAEQVANCNMGQYGSRSFLLRDKNNHILQAFLYAT